MVTSWWVSTRSNHDSFDFIVVSIQSNVGHLSSDKDNALGQHQNQWMSSKQNSLAQDGILTECFFFFFFFPVKSPDYWHRRTEMYRKDTTKTTKTTTKSLKTFVRYAKHVMHVCKENVIVQCINYNRKKLNTRSAQPPALNSSANVVDRMQCKGGIPIPLLGPGSVRSGSLSWDDCGRVFPGELRVNSFPW